MDGGYRIFRRGTICYQSGDESAIGIMVDSLRVLERYGFLTALLRLKKVLFLAGVTWWIGRMTRRKGDKIIAEIITERGSSQPEMTRKWRLSQGGEYQRGDIIMERLSQREDY